MLSLHITGTTVDVSIDFSDGYPLPVARFVADAAEVDHFGPGNCNPLVTTAECNAHGRSKSDF